MNVIWPTMGEAASRFWTAVFAGVTAIGLIAGGLYTLWQYFSQYKLQVEVATLSAKAPFDTKRLDLCLEASAAASSIASTSDPKARKQSADDFWRLYWGPLGIVEDTRIANAVTQFGDCFKQNCETPLTSLAYGIARACRTDVLTSFNLRLSDAPGRKAELEHNSVSRNKAEGRPNLVTISGR